MTARVEFEPDPRAPGRVAYRIIATTSDAVQSEVDRLMAEAEEYCGCASFIGPRRIDGAFAALGFVEMMEGADA